MRSEVEAGAEAEPESGWGAIGDGLGAGVERRRRREGSAGKCGGARGAAEGRDFFVGGGFVGGAHCGAAIGMGSKSGMGMGLVLVLA